jgi:hypothetical protein
MENKLEEQLNAISDLELAKKTTEVLSKLCETGGKSFIMSVPPQVDDTDVLFHELITRFEQLSFITS